jgi:hypothetical protein
LANVYALTDVAASEIARHIWFDPAADHISVDWLVDRVRQLQAAGLVASGPE